MAEKQKPKLHGAALQAHLAKMGAAPPVARKKAAKKAAKKATRKARKKTAAKAERKPRKKAAARKKAVHKPDAIRGRHPYKMVRDYGGRIGLREVHEHHRLQDVKPHHTLHASVKHKVAQHEARRRGRGSASRR